jgi:hypothetical protein
MGLGAIITTSDGFVPMGDDMLRWLVEARVEQELSKPTVFAIRFEDDLCEGEPAVARRTELQSNAVIGIFVKAGDAFECLVHGPITRVRTASMMGGTGSWVEIRGEDRRAEFARVGVQATYTGKASAAAERIITAYGMTPECEETRKNYTTGQDALNQRATDLAFLEDIARKNNLEFWLSYDVTDAGSGFLVASKVNLRSSPPRPASGGAGPPPLPTPPVLAPTGDLLIKVHPPGEECATVTKFETHIDFERPGAARGFSQDVANGTPTTQDASATDPMIGEERDDIVAVGGVTRTALAPPVTDPDEQFLAQQALLTEAAWFVTVDCSATLAQLGFAAQPHQVVEVKNAGERLSGAYQVMKAVHVINAADHYIDFTIRANGLRAEGGEA